MSPALNLTNRNRSRLVPDQAATPDFLFPRPRIVRRTRGYIRVPERLRFFVRASDQAMRKAARRLLRGALGRGGLKWENEAAPRSEADLVIDCTVPRGATHPQGFRLTVRPEQIRLHAVTEAGLRYGFSVLSQVLAKGVARVAALDIEDWPDFAVRGVMLDISRDKVPKMAELLRIIDQLADWRINQLQLYTEHTFAYRGHRSVWKDASPLTAAEVRRIDRYCRDRGIELVPNQNSFGHMERWLRHEPYRWLAETDRPWRTPWGTVREYPTTLCPLDPGSLRLMSDLYRQLLPHYSSRLFNVGCDETFELGQGRSRVSCLKRGTGAVYLDYLLKIHRLVRSHRRTMMFWADIILKHPRLIRRLPRDAIALIWGYEAEHPFARECRRVAATGRAFYVCPGTSSWCSFSGRTTNARENLIRAAAAGLRYGARGYLITDWGDLGHRQYAPACEGPLLFGAALSWCAKTNHGIDVGLELERHAWPDNEKGLGPLWQQAGDVHLLSGVRLKNRTVLFDAMERSLAEIPDIGGLTAAGVRRMRRRIDAIEHELNTRVKGGGLSGLRVEELRQTLAILRHACRRMAFALRTRGKANDEMELESLSRDMREIMRRHARLWRRRNRPGGLASSMAYYRKVLNEYARARRAGASAAASRRRP